MTETIATTISVPWLRHRVRWQVAAHAKPPSSPAPVLFRRWRRTLGAALTTAGAGTIATSTAGVAAQSTPMSLAQFLLAVFATVTVARCAVAGGREHTP